MAVDDLCDLKLEDIPSLRGKLSGGFILTNDIQLDELLTIAAYYSNPLDDEFIFESRDVAKALQLDNRNLDWALSLAVGDKYLCRLNDGQYIMSSKSYEMLKDNPLRRFSDYTKSYLEEIAPVVYEKLRGKIICPEFREFVDKFLEDYSGPGTKISSVGEKGNIARISLGVLRQAGKAQFGNATFVPHTLAQEDFSLENYNFNSMLSMVNYFKGVLNEKNL